MNWLKSLISGAGSGLLQGVEGLIGKFKLDPEAKLGANLAIRQLVAAHEAELEETLRAELGAKERILVAELQQGDRFTKRARPTVVYFGLGVIGWNYCLVPTVAMIVAWFSEADPGLVTLDLPTAFWAGWSGIVATWSIGRTMERRGSQSAVVRGITGSSPAPSMLG